VPHRVGVLSIPFGLAYVIDNFPVTRRYGSLADGVPLKRYAVGVRKNRVIFFIPLLGMDIREIVQVNRTSAGDSR
jgi:hypothetical protein